MTNVFSIFNFIAGLGLAMAAWVIHGTFLTASGDLMTADKTLLDDGGMLLVAVAIATKAAYYFAKGRNEGFNLGGLLSSILIAYALWYMGMALGLYTIQAGIASPMTERFLSAGFIASIAWAAAMCWYFVLRPILNHYFGVSVA